MVTITKNFGHLWQSVCFEASWCSESRVVLHRGLPVVGDLTMPVQSEVVCGCSGSLKMKQLQTAACVPYYKTVSALEENRFVSFYLAEQEVQTMGGREGDFPIKPIEVNKIIFLRYKKKYKKQGRPKCSFITNIQTGTYQSTPCPLRTKAPAHYCFVAVCRMSRGSNPQLKA